MSARCVVILAVVGCQPGVSSPFPAPQPAPAPASTWAQVPTAPMPAPAVARVIARTGASVVLARSGDTTLAYVADSDAHAIRVVDVDRLAEVSVFVLPGTPAQLVMLADRRLAVTLRDGDEVAVLAGSGLPGAPLAIEQRIAVAREPLALALTPDDHTLLVTSGWGHTLTAIAIVDHSLTVERQWRVAAEPRAVVAADDGKRAFVSHAVGRAGVEVIDLAAPSTQPVTRPIALAGMEEVSGRHENMFLMPRTSCQGFALAASIEPAGRIYAPQVLVFSGEPTIASAGYGGGGERAEPEVFDVAVVDEDAATSLPESVTLRGLLDGTMPCALPRAAATSSTGSLFVACQGIDGVVELDGAAVAPASAELHHWDVPAGPTGIAIDDEHQRAIVWSQDARALSTLDPAAVHTVALADDGAPSLLAPQLARGRALFSATGDARISSDGRACASCHPDGRQDTLVWSTPLGPRQTPMLAGRVVDTAPYGWNGDARDLPHHLVRTFARLHGTGLTGEDRDALIAYVTSLAAPSSPPLAPAPDDEGSQLYGARCAGCHGDDGRTPDAIRHDVHSWTEGDERSRFDTPSLAFVGGTAPYYHDGRYATLRDLVVKSRGRMWEGAKLSPHELDALTTYLGNL